MVEIPDKLPVFREFEDAVLRRGSRDPNKTLTIHDHSLQGRRPERMIPGTSPRMRDIAFLIELDELRSANAAVDPVIFSAGLVGIGFRPAIQKPDVVALIDEDTRDLLHAPTIRQRLRPERIHLE